MSDAEGSGAGQREVAYRIFAAEYDDADYSYSESDEDRAPNYVVTPTGARANRLFVVGVLTEIEQVSEDVLRARVVDPTGAFVLYAGQYQPDEQAFLEGAEPPTFVAVTGKARTFSPDDSEQVFTSIRPESISEVDAETRDRWTVQTAEQTLDRIGRMATAMELDGNVREELIARGTAEGLAHGVALALEHYGTTPAYLDAVREMALDSARVVAGERDEIEGLTASPGETGDVTPDDLLALLPDEPVAGTPVDDEETAAESEVTTSEEDATAPPEAGTSESGSVDGTGVESGTATDAGRATEESEAGVETGESAGSDVAAGRAETSEPDVEETADTGPGTGTSESDAGTQVDETDEVGVDAQPDETGDTDVESPAGVSGDESADGLDDFEPEEFELEDETREEIESEYGTEFKSGSEVDEPGNADIDTPEPEPAGTETAEDGTVEETAESVTDEASEDAEAGTDGTEETPETGDAGAGATDEPREEPEDLQEAVVALMNELDSGDGVLRDELVAEMHSKYGTDREAVEEAIQSALMDGQCYEPDDTSLKPI